MKTNYSTWLAIITVLLATQVTLNIYSYFEKNAVKSTAINAEPVNVQPAIKSMPDLPKTKIVFTKTTQDFGIIKDDKKQYTTFQFSNTGSEPLLIIGAEGSCGCTVPTWPKDPIAPGKTGNIEVAFDPNGKTGEHSKIVTITANTEPQTTILTVKATIIKSN